MSAMRRDSMSEASSAEAWSRPFSRIAERVFRPRIKGGTVIS